MLQAASALGVRKLVVAGDSMLVVQQVHELPILAPDDQYLAH